MLRQPRILLVVILGTILLGSGCRRSSSDQPRPAVTIMASYPGANVQIVADTVAAPIEQQVNGVEGMLYLTSRCGNDGTCAVTVTFQPGTDLNIAQVLVQNRVALAQPLLADAVKQDGVRVLKRSPGVLMLVALTSPEGRFSDVYLSNYVRLNLKDELNRLPGVQGVMLFGQQDTDLRVWLDPDKLAARNLTAADVVKALNDQNLQATTGANGPNVQAPLNVAGKLHDAEQLGDVVLNSDGNGRKIRLKDVARIELGAGTNSRATIDSQPCVLLGIYPLGGARPATVSTAVRDKLTELKAHFPAGIDSHLAFDFTPNLDAPERSTTPGYLLADVTLPAGASTERINDALKRCEQLLRGVAGVQHTLSLTDNPFDLARERPCVLAQLTPADTQPARREKIVADMRARLGKELPQALVRMRDLSGPGRFPRCGYPVDLAVSGPKYDRVRQLAEKIAERLNKDGQLTDAAADPDSRPVPQLYLDIDRTKCKALGVPFNAVFDALQVYLGGYYVNDFNQFGRTSRVIVQAAEPFRKDIERIKRLKVRSRNGAMVPLDTVVSVREIKGPLVLSRLDGRPMVEVTANPTAGVSLAQARAACEKAAEEVRQELNLPAEYRLTWLREMPAAR
jgi:multidrug efflux pump subunit AcrB